MYQVNALLQKKIVHDATGEEVGQVGGVVFDAPRQHVVALLVDHGLLSKRRVLRWPSVTSLSDVVVTGAPVPLPAANDDAEVAKLVWQETPVGDMLVISAAGERIGTISDMFIDRTGTVIGYEVKPGGLNNLRGSHFLAVDQIQAAGPDAIIARVRDLPLVSDVEQRARTAG
jgi:uncharacterized protein YrrD